METAIKPKTIEERFMDTYQDNLAKVYEDLVSFIVEWSGDLKTDVNFNVITPVHEDLIVEVMGENVIELTLQNLLEPVQVAHNRYKLTPFLAKTLADFLKTLFKGQPIKKEVE
jgi:hypothetical protein